VPIRQEWGGGGGCGGWVWGGGGVGLGWGFGDWERIGELSLFSLIREEKDAARGRAETSAQRGKRRCFSEKGSMQDLRTEVARAG